MKVYSYDEKHAQTRVQVWRGALSGAVWVRVSPDIVPDPARDWVSALRYARTVAQQLAGRRVRGVCQRDAQGRICRVEFRFYRLQGKRRPSIS